MKLQAGDIAVIPFGINREPVRACIHRVHTYDTGDMSIRWRFADNPQGIDWNGFIDANDPDVKILARGIAHVDSDVRSMIPN